MGKKVMGRPPVLELGKALSLVGLSSLRKLKHGYEVGWKELIRGYFSTSAMHALLNVGFLDRLLAQEWVSVPEYAREQDLDEEILDALCQSLYALGILRKQDSRYSLDAKGRLLMEVLRGWLEVSYGYHEIFDSLEEMLRKEKIYGKDLYRLSDFVAKGSGEMEGSLFFPMAIDIIRRNGYRRVLDLGCGDGTFLRQLCLASQEVTAFGIDLSPEATEDGRRRAAQAGLQDRIQLSAQDISELKKTPEGMNGLDAATIFFVLHELLYDGEGRVIDFLTSFRRIFPGVPLIVFEAIRPSAEAMRRKPGIAIYYFLYHDLSHQKPVSREKWQELFERAGFQSLEERYLAFARTAIYVVS